MAVLGRQLSSGLGTDLIRSWQAPGRAPLVIRSEPGMEQLLSLILAPKKRPDIATPQSKPPPTEPHA